LSKEKARRHVRPLTRHDTDGYDKTGPMSLRACLLHTLKDAEKAFTEATITFGIASENYKKERKFPPILNAIATKTREKAIKRALRLAGFRKDEDEDPTDPFRDDIRIEDPGHVFERAHATFRSLLHGNTVDAYYEKMADAEPEPEAAEALVMDETTSTTTTTTQQEEEEEEETPPTRAEQLRARIASWLKYTGLTTLPTIKPIGRRNLHITPLDVMDNGVTVGYNHFRAKGCLFMVPSPTTAKPTDTTTEFIVKETVGEVHVAGCKGMHTFTFWVGYDAPTLEPVAVVASA